MRKNYRSMELELCECTTPLPYVCLELFTWKGIYPKCLHGFRGERSQYAST